MQKKIANRPYSTGSGVVRFTAKIFLFAAIILLSELLVSPSFARAGALCGAGGPAAAGDTLSRLNVLPSATAGADTAVAALSAPALAYLAEQKRADSAGFFRRVVNYFRNANKPDTTRNFHFAFLPGPHYSSTTGFGIGMAATGTYLMDFQDKSLPKSNVAIYGDVTSKKFFMVGVKGTNIFPQERYRLDYRLYAYTFTTHYWGIGYDEGRVDSLETDYRRIRYDAQASFLFRVAPKMYIGPSAAFHYIRATDIEQHPPYVFAGLPLSVRSASLGISFVYDTRDFILNAARGWFVQFDQNFTPRFLGNGDHCYSTSELTVSTYRRVWQGAILAGELHGKFNYDGTPAWCLLADAGSQGRMRGYYEGRYRDRSIIEAQVELRQYISGRSGAVVWLGAAEVFPKFSALRFRKILPNAGVGYRWEFMPRVNVRLDLGFTRDGAGFMFNLNEAF